jgi:5-formyltetrahydrofolate cyclo-ligase
MRQVRGLVWAVVFMIEHLFIGKKTNTYPLGIAHDCQKVESVPVESWDIPLPEIITPNNHYNFLNNTPL